MPNYELELAKALSAPVKTKTASALEDLTVEELAVILRGKALMKTAFSITPEGHAYDADRAAIRGESGAKQYELSQRHDAMGSAKRSGRYSRALRFAPDILDDPRHQEYVEKKHREGKNAWNPFGGALTPSKYERDGNSLIMGEFDTGHKFTSKDSRKTKTSNMRPLARALTIHGLGGMVGHHYGTEQRKRGEKYNFGAGQVAGVLLAPGGLGYQIGRHIAHHPGGKTKTSGPVGAAIQKGVGTAARAVMTAKPVTRAAVGAGVGAATGAVAGGKDHRVAGAIGGAALGAGAGHVAPTVMRKAMQATPTNPVRNYVAGGMQMAAGAHPSQAATIPAMRPVRTPAQPAARPAMATPEASPTRPDAAVRQPSYPMRKAACVLLAAQEFKRRMAA